MQREQRSMTPRHLSHVSFASNTKSSTETFQSSRSRAEGVDVAHDGMNRCLVFMVSVPSLTTRCPLSLFLVHLPPPPTRPVQFSLQFYHLTPDPPITRSTAPFCLHGHQTGWSLGFGWVIMGVQRSWASETCAESGCGPARSRR